MLKQLVNTLWRIIMNKYTDENISVSKSTFISRQMLDKMKYDYEMNHMNLYECGKQFNINRKLLVKMFKKYHIHVKTNGESHTKHISKQLVKDLINYYNKGHDINECAKKFNLKRCEAYRHLKKNTKMRTQGERMRGVPRTDEVKQKISKKNKNHRVSDYTRQRMKEYNKTLTKEQLRIRTSKAYLTMKLNNSFKKSKPEEELYQRLLKENVNKTIYRQYKDKKRYPYYCDFYVKEDDLFIEVNAHWTHGGHPFNANNQEDINKLNEWKEKAKTSKFYQTAIEVWTIRDVEKQECAKRNKLNYQVIY